MNVDCIIHILSFFSDITLQKMKTVSKDFYTAVQCVLRMRYSTNYLKTVYPSCYLAQSYIISEIVKARKRDIRFIMCYSQIGTGKTAMMLWAAMNSPKRTTIIVPPKTAPTWLTEIQKWNLFHNNPKKSTVLFCVSNIVPTHQSSTNSTNKIIIQSSRTIPQTLSTENVIVDEAHIFPLHKLPSNAKEIMLFSASKINITRWSFMNRYINQIRNEKLIQIDDWIGKPHIISFSGISCNLSFSTKCSAFTGKYPDIIPHYFKTKVFQEEIYQFAKCYKRFVVFLNDKVSDIRVMVSRFDFDKHYVKVYSRCAKNTFDKKHLIIFCSYATAAEGVNFAEAEAIIFYGFNANSLEKAKQSLGRVRRLSTKNKEVHAWYALTIPENSKSKQYIPFVDNAVMTKLNSFYAMSYVPLFGVKGISARHGIIQELQKLKIVPYKLSQEELMLLFTISAVNYTISKKFSTKIPLHIFLTLVYNEF